MSGFSKYTHNNYNKPILLLIHQHALYIFNNSLSDTAPLITIKLGSVNPFVGGSGETETSINSHTTYGKTNSGSHRLVLDETHVKLCRMKYDCLPSTPNCSSPHLATISPLLISIYQHEFIPIVPILNAAIVSKYLV